MHLAYSSSTLDSRVADIAATQHGVITTGQLRAAGLSQQAVTYRQRRGRLHRRYRGVYAVGHRRLSQAGEWLAAVLACGDGAALSHHSAARLWGLPIRARAGLHVSVPKERRHRPGLKVHTASQLVADSVTKVDGVPVTTMPRTLVDLAAYLPPGLLTRMIHEAAYHDPAIPGELGGLIETDGRFLPTRRLAAALQAYERGSAGTRSSAEERYLAWFRGAGGPEPQLNVRVSVGDAVLEPDLYWPWAALVVEVDGPGHERAPTVVADAERDAAFARAGITVLRCGLHELREHAERVAALLRARTLAPQIDKVHANGSGSSMWTSDSTGGDRRTAR